MPSQRQGRLSRATRGDKLAIGTATVVLKKEIHGAVNKVAPNFIRRSMAAPVKQTLRDVAGAAEEALDRMNYAAGDAILRWEERGEWVRGDGEGEFRNFGTILPTTAYAQPKEPRPAFYWRGEDGEDVATSRRQELAEEEGKVILLVGGMSFDSQADFVDTDQGESSSSSPLGAEPSSTPPPRSRNPDNAWKRQGVIFPEGWTFDAARHNYTSTLTPSSNPREDDDSVSVSSTRAVYGVGERQPYWNGLAAGVAPALFSLPPRLFMVDSGFKEA